MIKLFKILFIFLSSSILFNHPTVHAQYLSTPEVIQRKEVYTHPASGMKFPVRVGGFQRVTLFRYDLQERDVSAGYNLITPVCTIAATIYVYPTPSSVSTGSPPGTIANTRARLLEAEFKTRKQEILNSHPGARLIQEENIRLPQGAKTYSGMMATFEFEGIFGGQNSALLSNLYLFCDVEGEWIIKYRFTYPKNVDASKEIEGFMKSLKWSLKGS
jgi:hypothetical protein